MTSFPSSFGRRLTQAEAEQLGYRDIHLREDDGTVQSMSTPDGYRVTYGAPSYASCVKQIDG